MATSNIVGRAQGHAIVNLAFGTDLPPLALDKPQESPYSGRNMNEAKGRRTSMSISSSFGFFWYWTAPGASSA